MMQLTEIISLRPHSERASLMASIAVPAGEPAEITNEFEQLDLNEFFTGGNEGIYMIRVVGDSMEAEIKSGDLLVVNRNLQARTGDKIIASINGSFTVKILSDNPNGLRLVASNGKYQPHEITIQDSFEIFGVVTHVIHSLKR